MRRACLRSRRRSWRGAASSRRRAMRCCALRACSRTVAAPVRARRLARDVLCRRRAERGRHRAACHRRVRPALATLRGKLAAVAWDKASIAAAIKETLAAHGSQDAAARAGGPGTGVRTCPDAVARRRPRGVRPGDGAGTTGARVERGSGSRASLAIISPFGGGDRLSTQKHGRPPFASVFDGGIAQLGERLHGMQEVSGSIPLTSTTELEAALAKPGRELKSPSSRGLGHHPFTVITGVRIP